MIRISSRGARAARRAFVAAAFAALGAACSGGLDSVGAMSNDVAWSTLGVDGGGVFAISGPEGGPFPDGERTYRLANPGPDVLAWELEASEPWLVATPPLGSLAAGDETDVTVRIDQAAAAALPAGSYPADLVFRDREDPQGGVYLAFELDVVAQQNSLVGGVLAVTPASDFDVYVLEGLTLDHSETTYVLSNVGSQPLVWAAWTAAPWLHVHGGPQGTLAPNESVRIDVELDAQQVLAFTPGVELGVLHFDNRTNGNGSTYRRVRATVAGTGTGRVTDGLLALYDFEEGGGTAVHDSAGAGAPLDLTIQSPGAVQWLPGALRLANPVLIPSSGPATKIIDGCRATDEITLEAWISPHNLTQDGPARIATLSADSTHRNVTLGQGLWGNQPRDTFNVRLRTTGTDLDGMPLVTTAAGAAQLGLQHVVYTRDAQGGARIFVDANPVATGQVGGDLSNWDSAYRFALGDEFGAARPWLGDLHLVAVYGRALTPAEVAQNHGAGTGDANVGHLSVTPLTDFVVTGPEGGPFAPGTKQFTLSNDGGDSLAWTASIDVDWVTLQGPTSGTLAAGDTVDLVCVLDQARLGAQQPGSYAGTLDLDNTTSGLGSTEREVRVLVSPTGGGGGEQTLVPGSGWTGATSEPGQIGSGAMADTKIIGNWNVVHAQDVAQPFRVGVAAFHGNGIDHVQMAVEGGPWLTLTDMRPNPRTDTTEYYAILDPALFTSAGPKELRALVIPHAGRPRLLEPLVLHVYPNGQAPHFERHVAPNGSDSAGDGSQQNPFRTIVKAAEDIAAANGGYADGGRILLANGDYQVTATTVPTQSRYLSITAAPGATRSQVRVTGYAGYGLNTRRLRFENVTLRTVLDTSPNNGSYLWLDRVHQKGNGQHAASGPGSTSTWLPAHFPWNWIGMTDCEVSDAKYGPTTTYFQRGTYIHHIGSDVFRYPETLINVTVEHVHPGSTGWHADLFEISGGFTASNMLVYGLDATDVNAQGIFVKSAGTALLDAAFVNCLIAKTDDVWISQITTDATANNLLLLHCSLPNESLGFRSPNISNVRIRGCVLASVFASNGGNPQNAWFADNHFVSGTTYGTGTSSGSPPNLFVSPAAQDWRPGSGSPLLQRLFPLTPRDLGQAPRGAPATIGVYE